MMRRETKKITENDIQKLTDLLCMAGCPIGQTSILRRLINEEGNVANVYSDIMFGRGSEPSIEDILLKLYNKIGYLTDRIESLESYIMDRNNFEDSGDEDGQV